MRDGDADSLKERKSGSRRPNFLRAQDALKAYQIPLKSPWKWTKIVGIYPPNGVGRRLTVADKSATRIAISHMTDVMSWAVGRIRHNPDASYDVFQNNERHRKPRATSKTTSDILSLISNGRYHESDWQSHIDTWQEEKMAESK